MDPTVLKYVGLTSIVYGLHGFLAIAQVALGLFLLVNGKLLLSDAEQVGKWGRRFGLQINKALKEKTIYGWLMILTGAALLLPILINTYWLTIIACPIAIYWLITLNRSADLGENLKSSKLVPRVLLFSVFLVLGFTVWEQKDLVRASASITYKAYYWNEKEVNGWQKTHNPNVPKVGEMPPDFELTDVNGVSSVRLSDFRGKKPVVLLFGSFT